MSNVAASIDEASETNLIAALPHDPKPWNDHHFGLALRGGHHAVGVAPATAKASAPTSRGFLLVIDEGQLGAAPTLRWTKC